MTRRRRSTVAVVVALAGVVAVLAAGGCVGTGKVARVSEIEPLPPGVRVAYEVAMACREGEAGFEYRFVVLTGTTDLTDRGPLPRSLRERGFYHSEDLDDDLPWKSVGYQKRDYQLRAEIGLLSRYLEAPVARQGPDPAALPAEVRDRPHDALLVALRPTDFRCASPL